MSLANDLINICPILAFSILAGVLLPETTLQAIWQAIWQIVIQKENSR